MKGDFNELRGFQKGRHDNQHNQGTLTEGECFNTVDLLIKATCFVPKLNDNLDIKMRRYELVGTRRSSVLNIPFSEGSIT